MIGYKYWVFYIVPEYYEKIENDLPIIINTDTFVYAYTDNKDYADLFEMTHDMRHFRKKKFNMTTAEVHELTLTERNKFMKRQSYATKYEHGVKSVDIIVTLEEEYAIEEFSRNQIMTLSLKTVLDDPNMFVDGLYAALHALKYDRYWEYQMGYISGIPFDPMTFMTPIDDLSVYTRLFGLLLKDGE